MEKPKTVFVLHTSFALVDMLGKMFTEQMPEVRVVNIVDDSLLADVRAAGHVTPSVTRRMLGYATLAQSAGADVIFNTCSSVGEVADQMRAVVDVPVVKIDESMAEQALSYGNRIAVVATVPTTLGPTARMVERIARAKNRPVQVKEHLAEGAFDALMNGDAARHDEMVIAEVKRATEESDAVVLAQGSMSRLSARFADLNVPVLSSPGSGMQQLKQTLARLDGKLSLTH